MLSTTGSIVVQIKQGLADLREEFPEADRHLKKRCSRDEPGQPAFEDRAGNEGLMEAILDIVLPGTASLTLKCEMISHINKNTDQLHV